MNMIVKFVFESRGSVVEPVPASGPIEGTTCGRAASPCPETGICPTEPCGNSGVVINSCVAGVPCLGVFNSTCAEQVCVPAVAAKPGGFDIKDMTVSANNNVSKIELRDVTKCTINAYGHVNSAGSHNPNFDNLVPQLPIPDGLDMSWGCNSGQDDWHNFGKIFAERAEYYFPDNRSVITSYTAIPSYDEVSKINYCAISVKMAPHKTCADLKFGDTAEHYNYFIDVDNKKITSAISTFNSLKVQHGSSLIDYPITNFIVTLDQSDVTNPKLEFTKVGNINLGCQHNEGENYISFDCPAELTPQNDVEIIPSIKVDSVVLI